MAMNNERLSGLFFLSAPLQVVKNCRGYVLKHEAKTATEFSDQVIWIDRLRDVVSIRPHVTNTIDVEEVWAVCSLLTFGWKIVCG
jgi:hypothetical protein